MPMKELTRLSLNKNLLGKIASMDTPIAAQKISSKDNNGLDEILEKSAKLMAAKGYNGTSMRDLALTTGRSLSGLYHYFSNKEELLYLINFRGFSSLLASSEKLVKGEGDVEQKLKSLIWNHVNFFSLHQNEMRVMMFGTQKIDDLRRKEISLIKHHYSDNFKNAVSDYIYSQSGKRLDKNVLDRKSYLLFGMMNWVYGWFSTDEHGTVAELAEDIYSTFTLGCTLSSAPNKSPQEQ